MYRAAGYDDGSDASIEYVLVRSSFVRRLHSMKVKGNLFIYSSSRKAALSRASYLSFQSW